MTALVETVVRFGACIASWIGRGVVALRGLGPYAAIELVLPGGTVLALLLWLYRRHRRRATTRRELTASAGGAVAENDLAQLAQP
jgi:hypothetical protein